MTIMLICATIIFRVKGVISGSYGIKYNNEGYVGSINSYISSVT